MKYNDGSRIELGDLVRLGSDSTGIVVAIISEGKFAINYNSDEWGYLRDGVLIKSSDAGLIHCLDTTFDFDLISRETEQSP